MVAGDNVIIGERAYADILNETLQNLGTETGGILLGDKVDNVWYVVESIDPGPKAILRSAYFEYDQPYVTHLANKIRRRYRAKLRLLGLWHRHPGSFDRFSSTDDRTNSTFARTCGGAAISGLVNIDPTFRMTFYLVTNSPPHAERIAVDVGDRHLPINLLRVWSSEEILARFGERPLGVRESEDVKSTGHSGPRVVPFLEKAKSWLRSDPLQSPMETSIAAPGPETSQTSDQLTLLGMFDPELAYLEAQHDYSYELALDGAGLRVTLKRSWPAPELPALLEFFFAQTKGGVIVRFGEEELPFAPGITKSLVDGAMKID